MKKTKLALLLLAALLAGVCIGFFTNSAIIQARIKKYALMPANMPAHVTQKLADRLHLDAAQQAQVLTLFMDYDSRMQATREKSQAMFDSLVAEMSTKIDQILTPAQKEEHLKLLAELDQRVRDRQGLLRAFPPTFVGKPGPTNGGK
jgi:hypothetical protein